VYSPDLLSVKLISRETATFLVKNFHYMKTMPSGCNIYFGIFHEGIKLPQGVAVFGRSSGTDAKVKLFEGMVRAEEIIEMQRLWISDSMGANAESKTLSLIMNFFKQNKKELKVVWTYAGGCKNDCGIVYQSSGFMDLGSEKCSDFYLTDGGEYRNVINILRFGKAKHLKTIDERAEHLYGKGKMINAHRHYYFYPIDKKVRRKMEKKALPFPKYSENFRKDQQWIISGADEGHDVGSNENIPSSNLGGSTTKRDELEIKAPNFQLGERGAVPTIALHKLDTTNKLEP